MTNYIIPYKLFVGSFTPNWLMRRTELSQGAKLCYARLCQFSGENGACYPSQATLAFELGVKERNVRNYLKELEAVKLIETVRGGKSRPNRYLFPEHEWMELRNKRQDIAGQGKDDRQYPAGQKEDKRQDTASQKAFDRQDSAYKENQLLRESTTTKRGENVVVVSSVMERIPEEHRKELAGIVAAKLKAGKDEASVLLNVLYSIAHKPRDIAVYAGRAVDFKYAESAGWTPDKAQKKKAPEVNSAEVQAKAEAEELKRQRKVEAEAEEIEKEKQRFLSLPKAERERLLNDFLKIAKPFDAKRIKRGSAEVHNLPSFLYFLKSA